MKTLAYTIAENPGYRRLACYSAERMKWATGLEVYILPGRPESPWWSKYEIFHHPISDEYDTFLYFDADIWARQKFDVVWLRGSSIAMVRENVARVAPVMQEHGLTDYYNAGLMYFNGRMRGVFERMTMYWDRDQPRQWQDQTPLNIELKKVKVRALPEYYNRILNPVRDAPIATAHLRHSAAINLHYTAMANRLDELTDIYRWLTVEWKGEQNA